MTARQSRRPALLDGTKSDPGTGSPRMTESIRARGGAEGALLTVEDVARDCGLSMKAIYRAIDRGELRAAKLCSRLRVRREDVDAWIERSIVGRSTVPAAAAAAPPPHMTAHNGLRAMFDAGHVS